MENKLRKEMLAAFSEALPHGTVKRVAEKAGVHNTAVSGFLKGRNQSLRIEFAVLQVIAEIRKERERLMREAGFKE
jgi:predicted transcriptional regulator